MFGYLAQEVPATKLAEPDCFDDDLLWILRRLTERAGGKFGLLIRFLENEAVGRVLARHDPQALLPEAAASELMSTLRPTLRKGRGAPEDLLQQKTLSVGDSTGTVRVIYMTFELAAGVTVVALCGQALQSRILFQEMIARRLHPVLQRYLRLWWMHRAERQRARALAAAADQSEIALVLLDRRGNVNFANAAAERLLDSGDGLRRIGMTLCSAQPDDMARLQAAVQHAILSNGLGRSVKDFRAPVVAVRRPRRRALMVIAMPLERPSMDPDDAVVVVYALDPDTDAPTQLSPAYRVYQLTATEARLVDHLVCGHSLAESAGAMRIGVPTARGYLKKVFQKTATNRQAELIRLMLASAVRSRIELDLALIAR